MESNTKMNIISLFVGAIGAVISTQASATVPHLLPIQGSLSDASGTPIDALTDITFSLYAAETGGTALWTDTFIDVDVETGFFSVYLGSNSPLDFSTLRSAAEVWLGITVESDPEMNRIRLAAAPFAAEAETCTKVGTLTEQDINDSFLSSTAPAASISSTQISQWSTAYGWGNHASQGYLTSYTETDPVYSASAAADISSSDVSDWNAAYSWGNHADEGYLTSYTETDPVYSASDAADIASSDISNWNTSYGWGNHASQGYLTSTNWAAPGNIGATTRASGAFTSLAANNGLTVSSGTVNLRPGGSGGTNGQVLTTDGNGNATWQTASASSSTNASVHGSDYVIQPTDHFIIATDAYTFTLPTAAAAGAGKVLHFYQTAGSSGSTFVVSGGNTLWDSGGNSTTTSDTFYNGIFVSDGTSNWFQTAQ